MFCNIIDMNLGEKMYKVMDGNKACSTVSYLFSEICAIYPITPSSQMASVIDKLSKTGEKNAFDSSVEVIQMQSEAGAAGAMHGALLGGSLATTFTASQGLLLMIPNMYKMAGERLPGVIHVASRSVATHALSIFGDHQDTYATRGTGFCILSSSNVQDAYNMSAIAHLSAIKGSLPFLHFFDGFRVSHEINKIRVIPKEQLLALTPFDEIDKFRKRALNVDNNIQKGLAQNEDIYFQSMETRNNDYLNIPHIVNSYMEEINKLSGTTYKPFTYYGALDAENIIIAMGSITDTIKLVIDEELKKGAKIGLITVHLYRPFSSEYLINVLPESIKNIAVLDRTKEHGSIGEPLYLDVTSTLKNKNINIVGGRYGLSSKNTTPAHIKSVFDMLDGNPTHNFTIGINDDVTNLSLKQIDYPLDLNTFEIRIYGFGSDGMVSATKDILEIIGDIENKYVQGYFEYDSKKSGGVTVSNIRIGERAIKAPFYVTNPSLVVITKCEYFSRFNMLSGIKENGTIVLNTNKTPDEINATLSNRDKLIIKEKNISFYLIDAEKIVFNAGIKGKISKIMETIILKFIGIDNFQTLIETSVKEEFKTKGEAIIHSNLEAIGNTLDNLNLYEDELKLSENEIIKENNIFERILKREGNDLPVSELMPHKDGTFPCSLAKNEKRKIARSVPKWISDNCIQCGQCSIVCPHAVIRPFILEDKGLGVPLLGDKDNKNSFLISISEADCTHCTLCEKVCPGRGGNKALTFGEYDEAIQRDANELFENHQNPELFDKYTIKGSQLLKPGFEFHGACAGCGETAYIKLLTQLYGNKLILANATGCSSIYGGSAPSTVYTTPWANSLFEDNAEFGFGMLIAYQNTRNRITKIMNENMNSETKELFTVWLTNKEDFAITSKIKKELNNINIPQDLKELIDYIPARSVWAIGGDGWAYDIGFGGIDHVLSTNEKLRILILDTEVYSNTGGQSSKASRVGQISEFAEIGKKTAKKDFFKIAMCYPNVYVASICMGANIMQTIKAFKEAEEHDGPAVIIAYSTCVEHGIKHGMENSLDTQKKIIECGYSMLMRYNGKEDKLYIDSPEPNFDKYEEFLATEVRYKALKIKNSELADQLFNENKNNAMKRYEYYKKLAEK